MKFPLVASILVLPGLIAAQSAIFSKEEYQSGNVHMRNLARKEVSLSIGHTSPSTRLTSSQASFSRQRNAGRFNKGRWRSFHERTHLRGRRSVPCRNGQAVVEEGNPEMTFQCKNVCILCSRQAACCSHGY